MSAAKVAITGMGCTSALGNDVDETWSAMKDGVCGIRPFEQIETYDLKIGIGGEIPKPVTAGVPDRYMSAFDRFTLLAMESARQAIEQAGLDFSDVDFANRSACIIGAGNCGWEIVEAGYRRCFIDGAKRIHVMAVPRSMSSAPASQISMWHGIKGPVYGVTSACASANHAIVAGYQAVKNGEADVAVVGGTDAPLIWGVLKAWEALRVLAPEVCRPFSANRKGLALADGAGVVVLENAEHAKARGAKILCEMIGTGITADAGDLVNPTVDGPSRALEQCLRSAKLSPRDVDYVNAHGTGTKANDATETKVIRQVFGSHADEMAISSTKSMHGHALGGSGGIELVACIKAIQEGIIPPTINYDEPDPECDLDVTPNVAKTRNVDVAVSNSFAFGGTNAVVAVRKAS